MHDMEQVLISHEATKTYLATRWEPILDDPHFAQRFIYTDRQDKPIERRECEVHRDPQFLE